MVSVTTIDRLVEATSSGPDDTKDGGEKFIGDVDGYNGYTAPMNVTDAFVPVSEGFLGSIDLRAECVGNNDRVYMITTTVVDYSGNSTTSICEEFVQAKGQGKPQVEHFTVGSSLVVSTT
jgi:hypothetical protein